MTECRNLPASGKVLVSACLAGRACAYDGRPRTEDAVLDLVRSGRAVLVCPEDEGGLGTPRPPAEVVGGTGDDVLDGTAGVLTDAGVDVTDEYVRGAEIAVARAREHGCVAAVLKTRSPACGCGAIYDGSFSGVVRPGDGVAAAAIRRAGLSIRTDEDL